MIVDDGVELLEGPVDRPQRERGNNRRDRDENRGNRADADESTGTAAAEGANEIAEEAVPAPRANRRGPRRARPADADEGNASIDSAVLPPAIGRPEPSADAGEADEAPAPKARRTRRTLAPRDSGVEAAE